MPTCTICNDAPLYDLGTEISCPDCLVCYTTPGVKLTYEGLQQRLADEVRATREANNYRDLSVAQLLMLTSEVCGDPKIDPRDRSDPRWTPALMEAAALREQLLRTRQQRDDAERERDARPKVSKDDMRLVWGLSVHPIDGRRDFRAEAAADRVQSALYEFGDHESCCCRTNQRACRLHGDHPSEDWQERALLAEFEVTKLKKECELLDKRWQYVCDAAEEACGSFAKPLTAIQDLRAFADRVIAEKDARPKLTDAEMKQFLEWYSTQPKSGGIMARLHEVFSCTVNRPTAS